MPKDPMRLMLAVFLLAAVGMTIVSVFFLSTHPYFAPSQPSTLPEGWIDESNYVSESITLSPGRTILRYIRYQGPVIPSIIILSIQPVEVYSKGEVRLNLNGYEMGTIHIEGKEKVKVAAFASCCAAPPLNPDLGSYTGNNKISISSIEFDGILHFTIEVPREGIPI